MNSDVLILTRTNFLGLRVSLSLENDEGGATVAIRAITMGQFYVENKTDCEFEDRRKATGERVTSVVTA
jgi:hypothetical protein